MGTLISIIFWRFLCLFRQKSGIRWPHWLYERYLDSKAWKWVRKRAIRKAGGVCQDCRKFSTVLDVHHITYVNLGWEAEGDLRVLDRNCHNKRHGYKR